MENGIFRKKSIDRMQSPDNLKEYIKVVNPSLFIVFIAAFVLLVGAFVWGYLGKIEDQLPVTVLSQNGKIVCEYNDSVEEGMKVVVGQNQGVVKSVSPSEILITLNKPISDGVYQAYIVIGEISPISFVFN